MTTSNKLVASTSEIRSHFPALERIHNGFPVAYFDGPGGTQVPRMVAEAMNDYLFGHNANTHWAYPTSAETDQLIEEARRAVADFFNCEPNEISFGANMTTITFHVARALGRGYNPGDEIVITELDHHANNAPRMAHEVGALVYVDAVHYAPHALVDVRDLECDFLACSAYKFYGPHIGALYGRYDLLESLDVPKLEPAPDEAPERLETGTQNHEGMVGTASAIDFLASLTEGAEGTTRRERLRNSFAALHARGADLLKRMWDGLSSIEGVALYGPEPDVPRTPTLSFTLKDIPSIELTQKLVERGVFASHGDFYAQTVVERLGKVEQGLLRAGCACYTTEEEVERLVEGVREIAASGGAVPRA